MHCAVGVLLMGGQSQARVSSSTMWDDGEAVACRNAGQRITMLVQEAIEDWLRPSEFLSEHRPSVLLDLLKLCMSGVLVEDR